jgi:hypothetical protein
MSNTRILVVDDNPTNLKLNQIERLEKRLVELTDEFAAKDIVLESRIIELTRESADLEHRASDVSRSIGSASERSCERWAKIG